jgi:hypothetical protein
LFALVYQKTSGSKPLQMRNESMNRLPAVVVILFSVIANGCIGPSVGGSGHVISETRNMSGFSNVSLEGSGHLIIEQGGAESLTVTGDDNLLSHIETEVRGSTLVLGEKDGVSLSPSQDIVFKVTLRKLDNLEVSGSGAAQAKGLQSAKLQIDLRGSGEVSAEGSGDDLDVTIAGSGRFRGDSLKSKRTRVDISGSGSAVVASSDTLDATISGSGSIEYVGAPEVHQSISGSGSVRQR